MTAKTGVYICMCGTNISGAMDVDELVKYASSLKGVVFACSHNLLCSEEGREFIKNGIEKNGLNRVVIAACSPKEHENTFMKVCSNAGLNPYLLQIANIREQCAWVTADNKSATKKAKILLAAAVKRVEFHEALEKKEIDSRSDVLVVGAGVSGIGAALALAQKKRKVYLVEKLPSIGGKAARYEKVFPGLECASCMMDPELDEVLHKENIEVLTYSEIEEVLGYYGNFIIKVRKKARYININNCLGCGACAEKCPVKVRNEFNEGLDERRAVYVPYPGALPNAAVIDKNNCLRFKNEKCELCVGGCGFNAVDFKQEDEVVELKAGAVVIATGFDIFDCGKAPQYGYGRLKEVYNGLEFERILSSTGPTQGKLLCKNGRPPGAIAIIHCVGSRSKKYNGYCSGICCMYSIKFAHIIKEKMPETEVFEFYSDFCFPGKGYQQFYDRLLNKGVKFVRVNSIEDIEIKEKDGRLLIKHENGPAGRVEEIAADMAVLSSAVEPGRDTPGLARIFSVPRGEDGFFQEEHVKLNPVSTTTKGIFIAGCVQGPKDIQSSVAQGEASAGKVLSTLVPGEKLELEAMITVIDQDICSGCRVCISLCPYKAIVFDKEKNTARVNELLCKGCGTCAAACPSGAADCRHFNLKEIMAEIEEAVK